MRAPDQIDKQHPETDLMMQAIIRGAEGYRVAVPLMEAWDNLPRSVQVAICMEFADLRLPAHETMAWAVIGEDGKINPHWLGPNLDQMKVMVDEGERVVRVAIRVVEDSDDAA